MKHDVYEPFEKDVEEFGGYQYTDPNKRSASYVNERFTQLTIGSVDLDGKRVVDVGCGDGSYTCAVRERTAPESLLGIDPAEKAIERANKLYADKYPNLSFRRALSEELVAAGEHFDVAIYRGVIHHVGDPAKEIATAMQLADRIFFIEPNGWNPVLKLLERFSPYHVEHEEQSYTAGTLHRWIEEAGGRVVNAYYIGLVPMFSPNFFVSIGSTLEPVIERIPVARTLLCGQHMIVAAGRGAG